MLKVFKKQDIEILQTYYCPFHPIHGIGKYKRNDNCRKPKPGMILKAKQEHKINLKGSVLIGDKNTDIQVGKVKKMKTT